MPCLAQGRYCGLSLPYHPRVSCGSSILLSDVILPGEVTGIIILCPGQLGTAYHLPREGSLRWPCVYQGCVQPFTLAPRLLPVNCLARLLGTTVKEAGLVLPSQGEGMWVLLTQSQSQVPASSSWEKTAWCLRLSP